MGHQVVVLSRRPGRIAASLRIDRRLEGRRAEDGDLRAAEARLWEWIREDAAQAAREVA
jgi:NitT/TauT family transport system ATP-binding protein